MINFYMMVGLPASGKTSYANNIENAIVHSSDKIREELQINSYERVDNYKVFDILHKRVIYDLKAEKNVVYDATNINRKKRMEFLKRIKNIDCYKICVVMAKNYENCLTDNNDRDESVPKEVILKMLHKFQTPALFEGFDEIIIINSDNYISYEDLAKQYYDMDQQNKHHKLTLGEHQEETKKRIQEGSPELLAAARIHDCGKPFVKSFTDKDNDAHYYHHENVGAYFSLTCEYPPSINKLKVSLLVNLHMMPFNFNDKNIGKYQKMWGEELFQEVIKLHNADIGSVMK